MKKSSKAALGAFGVAGMAAAVVLPIGGLVAGAYFVATAASGVGMGTLAVVALGTAGAIGGSVIGKLAILPVALTAAGTAKLVGAALGLASKPFTRKKAHQAPSKAAEPKGSFKEVNVKPAFDAAITDKNNALAKQPPASKPKRRFGIF